MADDLVTLLSETEFTNSDGTRWALSDDGARQVVKVIAAHLASDAVLERMAFRMWCDWHNIMHDHEKLWRRTDRRDFWLGQSRAAIAAATGG